MVDLSVELTGFHIKSPLIVAGGIANESLVLEAMNHDVGGVVVGTYALTPKSRHPPPLITKVECGYVNAYGVRRTLKEAESFILRVIERAERDGILVIGSVIEDDVGRIVEAARIMHELGVSVIELNLSAPVLKMPKGLDVGGLIRGIKSEVGSKISVKLPPLTSQETIKKFLGADIFHLTNALGPALVLDIKTGRPILKTESGCGALSGPAIKPIALATVFLASKAVPDKPIIGTGGIYSWKDAAEFIMAGATAVGLHSALYAKGIGVLDEILEGIESFMRDRGYSKLEEFRGLALRAIRP